MSCRWCPRSTTQIKQSNQLDNKTTQYMLLRPKGPFEILVQDNTYNDFSFITFINLLLNYLTKTNERNDFYL